MKIIDLARNVRNNHELPLKTPLKWALQLVTFSSFYCYSLKLKKKKLIHAYPSFIREMIVVHPDAEFLDDITGKLKQVCVLQLTTKDRVKSVIMS